MTNTLPTLADLTPLQQAILGYLAGYSGSTLDLYKRHLGMWLQWCADHEVDPMRVKRTHLELYLREREQVVKASSLHTEMTPVKGFYQRAYDDELIDRDPSVRLRLPKIHRTKKQPIERRELALMLMVARDISPRHWALMELLGIMALRISEVLSLTAESFATVEQGYRILKFTGKGSKPASMPLPAPVLRALEAAADASPSDLLVPRLDGEPLNRHSASGLLDTVCRRAGIKRHINPHLVRASVLTQAFELNIPPREVQFLARHDDLSTTSKFYDLGRHNHDGHAVHIIAARLAA